MKTHYNIRSIAAKTLEGVLEQGESLSAALPRSQATVEDRDKGLLQEICYGVLRVLPELNWYAKQLMSRPLEKKQRVFHYLLLVGFYQLLYMRIPPHAALSETVDGAAALKRPQLKGLINGVLRQFQRQQSLMGERLGNLDERYWHPTWLLATLKKAYPQQWKSIVDANNQRPPMWLRINPKYHDALAYQSLLSGQTIEAKVVEEYPQSVLLESPVGVDKLPDFLQGAVTVQDISAQRCVNLLVPQNGELILDLCAAPGGKTTHLLEVAPKAHVIAVEEDEVRAKRIKENLTRLKQLAEVIVADGRDVEAWRAGRTFDRILLDAPCSATGVIRRHPDIKWLRRETDIPTLVTLQKELLDAVWPHLKVGGVLLYATCSVLPQENSQQIEAFLAAHPDAKLELVEADKVTAANDTGFGLQVLPTIDGGDGFFYAKLSKIN